MTKDDEWKFCSDCKYFSPGHNYEWSLGKCFHPDSLVIKKDYIEEYRYYKDAKKLREGTCGSSAVYFEKNSGFWYWLDKIFFSKIF
jgi:hypothetical protein